MSCISLSSCKKFSIKPKRHTRVQAKVSSANVSDLLSAGIAVCSTKQGSHEYNYKFIVCKNHLHAVI